MALNFNDDNANSLIDSRRLIGALLAADLAMLAWTLTRWSL